jgi:hypothetical protein
VSPGIDGVAAGADAGAADWVSPGIDGVAAGADAGAADWIRPGIDGIVAGADAGAVAAAEGTPGKLMPGVAGAAGGVAPRAVARFCRICGALAAELISCCGRFGTGTGAGAGSAWAIPPVSSAADEPTTTAVARK